MFIEKIAPLETPLLDEEFKPDIDYLSLMCASREADIREGILFRQGRASFALPSAGHENMAALAYALRPNDTIFCHYRDRALLLARGQPIYKIALGFFAKEGSSSEGRQLASHFSSPEHNVVSCASPIASQCLPATGAAWAAKLDQTDKVVVCCLGEAGIREGEFYEAWCFAVQENLPVIFVIEDNGYGISTPTEKLNPLRLGIFGGDRIKKVNGRIATQLYDAASEAIESARHQLGPSILWVTFDRLMSHTSSDDQSKYRDSEDLNECNSRDPINLLRDSLFAEGELTADNWSHLQEDIKNYICREYERAEQAPDPGIDKLYADVRTNEPAKAQNPIEANKPLSMAQAINISLGQLLEENKKVILFGQDIADPKGGVFGLTRGLSTKYPQQVYNAPLAEATICGLAAGLALAGYTPVFELQFIDFMATGYNQIANQIATMRWRTAGGFQCPVVLLAPCGGYTHGGGPWHSQTNEALFAHTPGLNIYMPSNPFDAANLISGSAHGGDPSLILLPKARFFEECDPKAFTDLYHDNANVIREGHDVTVVTWGNCVELAAEAAQKLADESISIEVIDLKSIVPCDWQTIVQSLEKTGRVVVVHEDNRTCGFGQALIAEIVSQKPIWDLLYASPQLVCRDDILVPFNAGLAKQVLPSVAKIIDAIKQTLIV